MIAARKSLNEQDDEAESVEEPLAKKVRHVRLVNNTSAKEGRTGKIKEKSEEKEVEEETDDIYDDEKEEEDESTQNLAEFSSFVSNAIYNIITVWCNYITIRNILKHITFVVGEKY